MFTGIVEKMGMVETLRAASLHQDRRRLSLRPPVGWGRLPLGSSIAVDGACLTVSGRAGGILFFDLVKETLKRTHFSSLRPGDFVNLERALRASQRIEGHFVQGHVDGLGQVLKVLCKGREKSFQISFPGALKRYFIEKGSVAVNGVSLTIGKVRPGAFWVHVIPHTLKKTNLHTWEKGSLVNLETDRLRHR